MIQQPISGPRFKPQHNDRKQTSNLLGYYQTGAAGVVDEGNKVIKKRNEVIPLYDYEKWFCALVCFISLHYNIYGLHTLQKARRVTVNQDDNVLVCMPSANY